MLDVVEIQKLIPHRHPFLMVDRILELEKGTRIVGLKNVTMNEPFFQGHFPAKPVMPGVLVIEALAQTGGVLLFASRPELQGRMFYFTGMDNVRFRKPVVPGDALRLEVELKAERKHFYKMAARALVDGEVVAEAELSAMIVEENLPA